MMAVEKEPSLDCDVTLLAHAGSCEQAEAGSGTRRRSGKPLIAMMEPANLRNRDDLATRPRFHGSELGTVVVERLGVAARCCSNRCSRVGGGGDEPRSG